MSDTLVIIPTYNEAENIRSALDRALAADGRIDILVVDDGSPDGTAELAESHSDRVRVLRREGKQGLGTAYLAGFASALSEDYSFIAEMDADLSHRPEDLPRLIEPLASGKADLAIGSRYVNGVRVVDWPLQRLILSYGAGIYTRIVTRLPVMDVTAGFKCYRREVLEAIDLERVKSNGYSFQIEMKYRAWKAGFRVVEVPIVFEERTEGESKMSSAIVREAMWKVWELRLRGITGRL